jgi:hypothetical protein
MATQAEIQEAVLGEFGLDTESDTVLETLMGFWWGVLSSDYSDLMKYFQLKKRLIIYLISKSYKSVDIVNARDEVRASQVPANLIALLKTINDEIKELDPFSSVPYLESNQAYPNISYNDLPLIENYKKFFDYFTTTEF